MGNARIEHIADLLGRPGALSGNPSSRDGRSIPSAVVGATAVSFWDDPERREAARLEFELRMAIPILVAAALLTAITLVVIFADGSGWC